MKTNRQHEQKASYLFENKNNYYICMSVWFGWLLFFIQTNEKYATFPRKGFEPNLLEIKFKKELARTLRASHLEQFFILLCYFFIRGK